MARRDPRRRQAGALAASIGLHLAAFAVLVLQVAPRPSELPPPPEPHIELQLTPEPPRPSAPKARPRPSPQVARRAPLVAVAPHSPPRPPAPPRAAPQPLRPPSVGRPTSPAPVAPARVPTPGAQVPASGGARGAWSVQPDDGQADGVRAFLRATVGCSHEDYVQLSAGERAACDRRLERDARVIGARLDAMSPEARDAFDAAVEAERRARAAGMKEVYGPCEGQSNLGGSCLNFPEKPKE